MQKIISEQDFSGKNKINFIQEKKNLMLGSFHEI